MSDVLTKSERFALEAEEVFDEIPDVGPRRSLSNLRRIAIERPNRAIADVTGAASTKEVTLAAGTTLDFTTAETATFYKTVTVQASATAGN
jgi:hypothetical protein